jgi:hypothetical protein
MDAALDPARGGDHGRGHDHARDSVVVRTGGRRLHQQGKQINRVLQRDRVAWELGLAAGLRLAGDDSIEIRFVPASGRVPGEQIELLFVHATRPGLDRRLLLDNRAAGPLRASLVLPGEGRWNLYLQTADWRLTGSLRYPQDNAAELLPNYGGE